MAAMLTTYVLLAESGYSWDVVFYFGVGVIAAALCSSCWRQQKILSFVPCSCRYCPPLLLIFGRKWWHTSREILTRCLFGLAIDGLRFPASGTVLGCYSSRRSLMCSRGLPGVTKSPSEIR